LAGQCKFDVIYFVFFFPPTKKMNAPHIAHIGKATQTNTQTNPECFRDAKEHNLAYPKVAQLFD